MKDFFFRIGVACLRKQIDQRSVSDRPFRIVLAGRPNVGKSSLFNALVGRPAAIVSADVRPRVVQLSTGAWFDPDDPSAEIAMCVHGKRPPRALNVSNLRDALRTDGAVI